MNHASQLNDELDECAADAALYALNALPSEKARAVELRLQSGCKFCAAQVKHHAALADDLSLSVAPVRPPRDLRGKLMASLELQERGAAPNPNRKVVRFGDGRWMKMPVPGVEIRPLIGEKTFMIRMQAGAVFPKHDHPQAEQCYVLSGSITDSDGLTLQAGDFVVMSRDIQHDPIRSTAGCTLLIAYAD